MLKGHFQSAGASVEYGAADALFPVEELDAAVDQYRDAELALEGTTGAEVIVIAPTSMATSIALTQRPLTVVAVDSLPTAIKGELDDVLDAPIHSFELIQIGKWNTDSPNSSLAEFSEA